ncbi:hypothetical protein DB31_1255 [Hyalangium minutum]|uniref:Lipoprotein n=2 Tax=Hyalangium minutum TaxID=394096 RepID=A0A085WES7_9BACT|nr:hypothetical protein DB31_1255 [Hyalangium minutum]
MAANVWGALRRCALCLLVGWLTLAATGCATPGELGGGGTAGTSLPPGERMQELEQAAESEAALLAAQISAVSKTPYAQGVRLSFTFWNERGALSLTDFSAQGLNGPAAAPLDDEKTRDTLATVFSEYSQRHTGQTTLTLRREQTQWAVGYAVSAERRPPEARVLPVLLREFPAELVRDSTEQLHKLLASMEVPAEGEAWAEVEVHLEDGHIEGWRPRLFQVERGGGRLRPISSLVASQAVQVLLPFTLGMGPRTVIVRLRLLHRAQESEAVGWVESARVERPPLAPEINAAFVAEYRAMHESILWRWRYEVREGAEWAARRGTEELALWYAGGVLLKGGGYLARWAGSAMRRALVRGGEAATGWLRTALLRLPGDKKREFEWLWAKVQLEGERALTAEERASLRGLMERIEQLAHTRLDESAKRRIRAEARSSYKSLRPELKDIIEKGGRDYPIHHRRQLEHAHLFPDENVNAAENLALVQYKVHEHINRAWDRFRQLRPEPTAQEVRDAARAIDAQFSPWYDQIRDPLGVTRTLGEAETAALKEVERLFLRGSP